MIDSELAAKLQRRRGVVDSKGDEWEKEAEQSSADARHGWIAETIGEAAGESSAKTPSPRGVFSLPTRSAASERRIPAAGSSVPGAGAAGATAPAGTSAQEPESDFVPEEAVLLELLAELKRLGRTDAGRALLLSQTTAVRRALGEILKNQSKASAAQPAPPVPPAASEKASGTAQASSETTAARHPEIHARAWPKALGVDPLTGDCTALAAAPAPAEGAETTTKEEAPDASPTSVSEADLRTIRADVERTRKQDAAFHNETTKSKLETLLARFCEAEKIRYTQGLHEVAAPFAYLQLPENGAMADAVALSCLRAFVRKFVPYFHDDESFVTLHISLLFFRQLLLYHHPDLQNQLSEAGVSPFLYATPWFITLFAARTPITVLLNLWDRYLARNDETFMPFLGVAMLAHIKSSIISAAHDEAYIAAARAGIGNDEHLEAVWTVAESLRNRTPKSFEKRLARVLEAVREKRAAPEQGGRNWTEHVLSRVERERRFVVLPAEVVAICLQERAKASKLRFLLLDLRTPDEQHQDPLPQALHFYPSCLRKLIDAGNRKPAHLERLAATLSSAVKEFITNANASASASASSSKMRDDGGGESGGDSSSSNKEKERERQQEKEEKEREKREKKERKEEKEKSKAKQDEQALIREVFEVLTTKASERWGEDWVSSSAGCHLILLGGAADTADFAQSASGHGAVAAMYEALTEDLSFARVSVVLGGAAAVLKVAKSAGLEAGSNESITTSVESFLGSAWSKFQAAKEALPPRDVASERLGGFFHSIKGATSAVRHSAAGRAATARQTAAEGISAIGTFLERFDESMESGASPTKSKNTSKPTSTSPPPATKEATKVAGDTPSASSEGEANAALISPP